MINESGNEYELTADVFTDVAIFSETHDAVVSDPEASPDAPVEQMDAFVFSDAPVPVEEEPVDTLTAFEQQTLDAVLAGDLGCFAPAFINDDGSWNYDLWSSANTLGNDLVANGIAVEDYSATATSWFLA